MKTKEEILQELPNFYGTEHWYHLSPMFKNFVITDGVKYLAEAAGAYWLVDAIASHFSRYKSRYKNEDFVVAKLSKQDKGWWKLRLEDGNDNILAEQAIEYSDFPLDEITLYVESDGTNHVILLPSEH